MTNVLIYLLDTHIVSHLMRDAEGSATTRYRAVRLDGPRCRMSSSVLVN